MTSHSRDTEDVFERKVSLKFGTIGEKYLNNVKSAELSRHWGALSTSEEKTADVLRLTLLSLSARIRGQIQRKLEQLVTCACVAQWRLVSLKTRRSWVLIPPVIENFYIAIPLLFITQNAL
jgi:hypothetical protein